VCWWPGGALWLEHPARMGGIAAVRNARANRVRPAPSGPALCTQPSVRTKGVRMPDNLSAVPLARDTMATDQIGGVHHQRVKIQHGVDGSATDVSSVSPLPVSGPSGVPCSLSAGLLRESAVTYMGMSVRNASETSRVSIDIYDNASAGSGAIIDTVSLIPGQSRETTGPRFASSGLYCVISGSGTPVGSIFTTT
jgi:hypothetical protein